MRRTGALRTAIVAAAVAVGAGCSPTTRDALVNDLTRLGEDAAVAMIEAAITANGSLRLQADGRIPVAAVASAVSGFTEVAEITIPDADGDGFVDGGRISIRVGKARACIEFTAESPSTVACR